MFWFKNAIIYRLTKTLDWSTSREIKFDNYDWECPDPRKGG